MVVTGVLTLLSLSFTVSVRDQVAAASEGRPGLYAEMAAYSALEFALKNLSIDAYWEGTGEELLPLGEISTFQVIRLDDPGQPQGDGGDSGGDQITICHRPPGNPGDAHTISISANAWPAHEAHGDTMGSCDAVGDGSSGGSSSGGSGSGGSGSGGSSSGGSSSGGSSSGGSGDSTSALLLPAGSWQGAAPVRLQGQWSLASARRSAWAVGSDGEDGDDGSGSSGNGNSGGSTSGGSSSGGSSSGGSSSGGSSSGGSSSGGSSSGGSSSGGSSSGGGDSDSGGGDDDGGSTDSSDPGATFLLIGNHGVAQVQLEMSVEITPVDEVHGSALVILGGETHISGGSVDGDILVADDIGYVEDWIPDPANPDSGSWQPGGAEELTALEITGFDLSGAFKKVSAADWGFSNEVQVAGPLQAPSWNLEPYLDPGPDRVVYEGVSVLSNVVVDETAVFVLDPGVQLRLHNVDLRGGVVFYVEPDFDLRGPSRNPMMLEQSVVIGGGDGGVSPNLGLLAPGAAVSTPASGDVAVLIGMNHFHSVVQFNNSRVTGQLVVLNEILEMNNSDFVYDPAVTDAPPLGMGFAGGSSPMEIQGIHEVFDPQTNPLP